MTIPLTDIFMLRRAAYVHACEDRYAGLWISVFLLSTGIIYGVLVALLQRSLGGELKGVPVADIPLWVLILGNTIPGIMITVMIHIGIMLVTWMMAKAFGGRGGLAPIYRSTAYLLPLTLPALPTVAFTTAANAVQSTTSEPMPLIYQILAIAGAALFLSGVHQVLRFTQDFTPSRAMLATVLFAAFSFSILLVA